MNGRDVDWFVVLKAPIETQSDDPIFHGGYAYSYADAENSLEWTGLGKFFVFVFVFFFLFSFFFFFSFFFLLSSFFFF